MPEHYSQSAHSGRRPHRSTYRVGTIALLLVLLAASALAAAIAPDTPKARAQDKARSSPHVPGVPRPDHVVVVVEENHAYSQIIGSPDAPYINSLAQQGALFTDSYGVEHPSQPNYLDIFSGSNQGVTDNTCPHTFSAPSLGGSLLAAGLTFVGYAEDLPAVGSDVCLSGAYARKHNPWSNFTDVLPSLNQPFSGFPSDFNTLPTLAWVTPNLDNDMHDGTIQQGDSWLQQHFGPYIQWASTHNSLFILTFDEDDFSGSNWIATLIVGPMVAHGAYSETINHYHVLRTIEDMYDLPHLGNSAGVSPITDIWLTGSATPGPTITPGPTQTQTPPCAPTFSDVQPTDYFYQAVTYLYCRGAISGYADGTFRPYNNTTRGQMSKILVLAEGWPIATPTGTPTFRDVAADSPFYPYVETAYSKQVVSGYGCGANCLEFRPGNNITRAQLAKVIVLAQNWPITPPSQPTFADVPSSDPFFGYVETAYARGIISGYSCGANCLEYRPGNNATRGQISKILYGAVTGGGR